MATQTDVQQLIQGLTPSAVNNGNPNTAYNNAPGGGGAPVMDAFGNWSLPQVSRAASVALNRGLPAGVLPAAPARQPFFPPLPPLILNPDWATPPVVQPPVAPPVAPPVVAPVAPPPSTPLVPPGSGIGDGTGQGGWMGGGIRDIQDTATFNGIGATNGMNLINSGAFGNTTGGGTSPLSDLGWQDYLDMILPGNAYLSGTGQWDLSNLLGGLGDMLAGLPGVSYGDAVDALGRLGIDQGWDSNNFFVQQYMDNALNRVANNFNEMGNEISAGADANTAELVKDIIAKFGGTSGTPSTRWGTPTTGISGGPINVSGGAAGYNNGAGAGTGFGTQQIWNIDPNNPSDTGNGAAAGFGIGATNSGSAGSYALSDALRQNRLNRV